MPTNTPSHSPALATLAARHQTQITQQRSPFTLRMHRALSWLQRAEAVQGDDDVAFVCLWIGFNAAYAQDLGEGANGGMSERQAFRNFMADVCALDKDKTLCALVWQVFPGPIRILMDNQYVFQPIWDALNNPRSDGSIPSLLARIVRRRPPARTPRPGAARHRARAVRGVRASVHAAQPVDAWRGNVEQFGQPRPGARWPGAAGAGTASDAGGDDG